MSELSYEASDEASENELLERSLSVWRGWSSMREDFTPIPLDIHTASSIGQYDCVRTLISRGEVVIDRKNVGGWTPLMYACYIGHDHIASLLIDAGCNVNMKNQRGQVPLMLAASCGNETVGRTLLRKGAELEAADRNGWTALFHATYSGHQNFVSFLLDQQANMDAAEPSTGMTPFMKAAIEGHEIIVQLFLQHGVNVNAKAYNGDTARTLALTSGYMKIVSLIDNHVMPHSTLRSEPGLGDYLSSSDEVEKRQRPQHQRGSRAKSKGPSIRDGPEAIARMIDRSRTADHMRYPHLVVPRGYMSFPHGEGERAETLLSYRDVTSPINQEDYHLDSSGGKDSCDYDDSNAFSKTGAITIKSSSSSSGGLIGLVGLSRQNSADSDDFLLHDSGVHNSSQSEDNADGEASSCEPAGEEEKERAGRHGASKDQGAPQSTSGKEAAVRGSERGHQEEGGGGDPSDGKSFAARQGREEGSCDGAAAGGGSAPSEGCHGEAPTSGKEAGVIPAAGVLNPLPSEDSRPHPFHLQFGDVVFPEVMGQGAGGEQADSPVAAAAFSQTTARAEHYSETLLLDRNHGFDPSPGVENSETVRDLPAGSLSGCTQFTAAGPPLPSSHMQRRSSCQARLSRLSVVDRDGGGGGSVTQGKEVRHRRRSANSPPTFHREYGGRGQDLGSGTGRVSCLSDIPTNPGPQAGYPVTSSTRNSSQLSAIKGGNGDSGGGGGDRFQGNSQVPVAAVAPTCLPPGFTSLTPHPTSAFVTPQNPQLHKYPTPEASSDSAQDSNPTGPVPTGGHQSDSSTAAGREPAGPGGSGEPEGGVPGHRDLAALLEQLGLSKYAALFVEQDVDLQVFLSLTDNDLKEIGIKLFGPRKKMTNAIARWHSQAPAARSCLEQAYADRLEGEMQEMAIQLNQAYDSVEKLRAQVLQERQLRSVTESCLMEERGAWQRVHHSLLDTHQHCADIADAVSKLSSLQAELKQRLGQPQNNNNHLPSTVPPSSSDLVTLTTEQLIHLCDQYLYDLRQHSAALARNMDCIISNPPATGAIHEARDIDQDFA